MRTRVLVPVSRARDRTAVVVASTPIRDLPGAEWRRAWFWLLIGIVCVVIGALIGFLVFRPSIHRAGPGVPETRPSDASGG